MTFHIKKLLVHLSAASCDDAKAMFGSQTPYDAEEPLFSIAIWSTTDIAFLASANAQVNLLSHPEVDLSVEHRGAIPLEVSIRWPAYSFFALLFTSLGWPTKWKLRIHADEDADGTYDPLERALGSFGLDETFHGHPESLFALAKDLDAETKLFVVLQAESESLPVEMQTEVNDLVNDLGPHAAAALPSAPGNSTPCTVTGRARYLPATRRMEGQLGQDPLCAFSGIQTPRRLVTHVAAPISDHMHRTVMGLLAQRLKVGPDCGSSPFADALRQMANTALQRFSAPDTACRPLIICDDLHRDWCNPAGSKLLVDPWSGIVGSGRRTVSEAHLRAAWPSRLGFLRPHELSPEVEVWLRAKCGAQWPEPQTMHHQTLRERPELLAQCCESLVTLVASPLLRKRMRQHARRLLKVVSSDAKRPRPQGEETRALTWADYQDYEHLTTNAFNEDWFSSRSSELTLQMWYKQARCLNLQDGGWTWGDECAGETRQAFERQRPHLHQLEFPHHEKWTYAAATPCESEHSEMGIPSQRFHALFPLYLGRCVAVLSPEVD
ncbi:unnamed protein product [Parajaminaea phylloscopi]